MSVILRCFQPLLDALFCSGIPFHYRCRLLGLLPLNCLSYPLKWLPWLFSPAYSVTWIPLRRSPGSSARALVSNPKLKHSPDSLQPLHIDIHGGGFVGGIPELDTAFNVELAKKTGAVVISLSYRLAPRHTFPTAHQDVQDAAAYIVENAERLWGADPKLLTLSGFSVGANLALGISQSLWDTETPALGSVTFYNPVDFRIPPWEKPKPPGYPTADPLAFLQPLFDSYVNRAQSRILDNSLMNPILADIRSLPPNMLFVIAGMDTLLNEQATLVERLKKEAAVLNANSRAGNEEDEANRTSSPALQKHRVESMVFEGQLHGWLELPSFAIDESTKTAAFDSAFKFIREIHSDHGWVYNPNP